MKLSTPAKQHAVQLVGPDKLQLNQAKDVYRPGRRQILCRVEAVGLCFSDLKLLKQFTSHVRKSEIVAGIDPAVLKEFPSYVPGEAPAVPGHEAVVRVQEVGEGVTAFKPGERYLVQTDYRWIRTASSNAAFGYNIEGALQEYVLLDERIFTSPEGESMMIPASEELSASAIALVEPWACVEDAYASKDRRTLKKGGRMLVVAEARFPAGTIRSLTDRFGNPAEITWVSATSAPQCLDVKIAQEASIDELGDETFDDVIYFGANAATVEKLFARVGTNGLLNIVQCGGKFGRKVVTAVGRVHYGGIRIIGTTGSDPARAMEYIPASGEIRPNDKINVIGAGGPMGVMHVIRNICQGVQGVTVFAGDIDDGRLAALDRLAKPLAAQNKAAYRSYNSTREKLSVAFDYAAVMAPVPALVALAVNEAGQKGIVNIFAGIPATVSGEIDLDAYVQKELYFIGTSGSVLEDMKTVLRKVEAGTLDTNLSVGAIAGLDGAVDGIRAVENRLIAGKIIVYPSCHGLGLMTLEDLKDKLPSVAGKMRDGLWNVEAEKELLSLRR